MIKFKCALLGILLVSFHLNGSAQLGFLKNALTTKLGTSKKSISDSTRKPVVKLDTIAPKPVSTKKPLFNLVAPKKLTQQQEDSAFLKHPFKDAVVKFKQDFKRSWDKVFVDFTDNEIYLHAGMNVSKQNISMGGYQSSFNYDLADYNKNVFKPGYYAGFRVDGKFKEKHNYSFEMSLNKIAAGTNYKEVGTLAPFIGNFSKFKADDQFFTLSIAAHYKKLIPLGDTVKHKFYIIAGPSIDTRLSGQSADNLVNNNYQRLLLRGDIGVEFDNQSYYTLFVHYKQGITSFTKAPIVTNLNSLEIGMMLKASDLF